MSCTVQITYRAAVGIDAKSLVNVTNVRRAIARADRGEEAMQWELPVSTYRLVLRPLTHNDLKRHAAIFSDPDVVRYLYEEPLDLVTATEHLARRCRVTAPPDGEWWNLGVELKGEGKLIGEVGFTVPSSVHRHSEIGYVFDPAYSGHGYATEAASFLVGVVFTIFNAHRVSGRLDARNLESQRLLERLGMRREAHFRENEFVKGEWTDELVFALLRDEWSSDDEVAAP